MTFDMTVFGNLKRAVCEMECINNAIIESHDILPAQVLGPVLGDIEFDQLSATAQVKLEDMVKSYLELYRNILDNEMELKALDIQQLKR